MTSLTHVYGRVVHAVRQANRILLVAHKKPDGDAIGASTAFYRFCKREHKDVTLYANDLPSISHAYISETIQFTNDPACFNTPYDLVIVFDSGDLKYAGIDEYILRIPVGYTLINIDHHPTNHFFGSMNVVSTDKSSTSEIIYDLFTSSGIAIDADMATSLLTGICFDTTNFSNALTTDGSMEASSELIRMGARFTDILKYTWNNKTTDGLKLWGVVLSRLHYNPVYDIVSSYLTSDELAVVPNEVSEGMVNFLSAVVRDADMIMLLKERSDGYVRGSLRSQKRDVSKIAKLLGGGGHKKAAGFSVEGKLRIRSDGSAMIVGNDRTIAF